MADLGLFTAPEDIQRARFMQEAQMTPNQRLYMMGAQAGQQVGKGVGSLFGVDVQDPTVARATKLRELGAKYGTTTAEALDKIAAELQQTDPQMAMQVAQKAQEMKLMSSKLETEKQGQMFKQAQTAKEQYAASMEEKLRDELSKLSPEATDQDILGVVSKYGSPDKVLAALQASQNKKADREQKAELQKEKLADQERRDRERAQERKDFAFLMASLKQGQGQGTKPLSAAELKDVNKLRSSVDTANNTIDQADTYIDKIDKGQMVFGAGENALGAARKLFGKANESDLNKVEFEQFVTSSVNSILNLAKGPQTDQDAKRAEKQIIDALSKNDNKAVKRGLESLKKVWNDAKATDMSALELYSAERGGKNLAPSSATKARGTGTKDDPIILK